MGAATFTPTRCNYCREPAAVRFTYHGHLAACIVRRQPVVTVAACAEHEGCVNWNGVRALHAEAPLERMEAGRWVRAARGEARP